MLWLLLVWLSMAVANAQNTERQLRPELDIYVSPWEAIRFEFENPFQGDRDTENWRAHFALYIEAALKPVLRRELRSHPDVYRNRYLTVRAGYQYRTGIGDSPTTPGNTAILEVTSRYRLPWRLFISDRNRGDFRFLHGEPFFARYRNRLQLERDIRYRRLNFTAYLYDEIYYDTRYDRWTPNRYAAGLDLSINAHLVLEPYYLRQHSSRSNPPHIAAFGFKVKLYF
ncbi:MAG TPA: DUF2490 domain-containing protein [Candidatus Solibacter sp.]|nr:DUF2490 domain-containing protein [Candidatus Solibacter sp.]